MRIGEQKVYEKESASLYEWTSQTGFGLFGMVGREDLPNKCIEYCMSAMPFFGLSNHPTIEEVIRVGAWNTYWVLDIGNPYALFMGVSDVNYTEDWQKYTFEIFDEHRKKPYEANPEHLETYKWVPGQAEQVYQDMLKQGGDWADQWRKQGTAFGSNILDTIPMGIGSEVQMHLDGDYGESAFQQLEDQVVLAKLNELCNGDIAVAHTYFEVAAWAAFAWMAGPDGREWRNSHHDIFYMASKDGVAFMYDSSFIEAEHIRALQRAPQSCVVCGLDAYCVEMAHISGTTRFLCEHHMNEEPVFEGATCGTKICKAVQCPHHPLHGQEHGLMTQLRKTGQLTSRRDQALSLGSRDTKLIGN